MQSQEEALPYLFMMNFWNSTTNNLLCSTRDTKLDCTEKGTGPLWADWISKQDEVAEVGGS